MGVWRFNFSSSDDWAAATADALAVEIRDALSRKAKVLVAIAGGRTPSLILPLLQRRRLPWARLRFIPTDDRLVEDGHPARNLDRLREWLAPAIAGGATLGALECLSASEYPDVVMLGLGADGHVASIFPDGEGMKAALTETQSTVRTTPSPLPPEAPFPRITLTLAALLAPRRVIISASGADKKDAYDLAIASGHSKTPVAILLEQDKTPLSVFLCAPAAARHTASNRQEATA